METQLIINLVILALFGLIGFNGTQLFQAVKELRITNAEVMKEISNMRLKFANEIQKTSVDAMKEISSVQIKVAQHYPTKAEIDRTNNALFDQLRRIEDKLDEKADKNDHKS